jgi:hypothetical protein
MARSALSLSGRGLFSEGAVEFFIEKHPFLPQGWLVPEYIRHADGAVDENRRGP